MEGPSLIWRSGVKPFIFIVLPLLAVLCEIPQQGARQHVCKVINCLPSLLLTKSPTCAPEGVKKQETQIF